MIPPPPHIQEALDLEFPGVRLEWNARIGFWCLTDDFYHPDGTVAWDGWVGTPPALVGIEPYGLTQRKLIWVIGDIQTGERWPIYFDRILESLRRAFRGTRPEEAEAWIDEVEASEDRAEAAEKADAKAAAREAAASAWDGLKKSTFGKGIRKTAWTYSKAIDKAYAKKRAEEAQDNQAEIDAEVARRVRAGDATMLMERQIGVPGGAGR